MTAQPGMLVPIFDQANLHVPTDLLAGFEVGAWRTIVWAVAGAGTDPTDYLWLRETWSFPQDVAGNGWPTELVAPTVLHPIVGIATPAIDYQLRAVTPRAPMLTLGLTDIAGSGRAVHARVWGSPYELTTADLWPGPFVLAQGLSINATSSATLVVPAFVGPVIAHAWSDATGASSRIHLLSGENAGANRIDILWKPANGAPAQNAPLSREVMLPPGPNTIVCVNNDNAARLFDVALTPIVRR